MYALFNIIMILLQIYFPMVAFVLGKLNFVSKLFNIFKLNGSSERKLSSLVEKSSASPSSDYRWKSIYWNAKFAYEVKKFKSDLVSLFQNDDKIK